MPTSRTTPLTTSLPWLAALFATLLSTSACFDSSWFQGKSSQQSVAQARTPQTLRGTQGDGDSPPPTLANVRTMRVRARATPRHIAEITDWQRRFSEMLEDANRVLVPTLSVRLEIATATEWSPRTPDDALAAQLAELAATDPGDDVDWVIGLTGSVPRFEESFHELGMAHMPGKHAVLRAINDARELEAIEKGFPDLSEADRSKLFLARKRHKRATVLLHEIGHTLGAPHQPVPSAIMTPRYGIAVESYGPAAAELLRVAVDDRRTPAAERNPRAFAEASIAVLRRWPDQWTADEREQAIARHQQQRQASPARTAATPPPAPPAITDTGLDTLTPDHRAAYDRATAAQTQGRDAEAWAEATPLFDVYPGVAAVQDLRCRLAMKLRSWSEAKKECAALVPEARPRREVPPQERKKRLLPATPVARRHQLAQNGEPMRRRSKEWVAVTILAAAFTACGEDGLAPAFHDAGSPGGSGSVASGGKAGVPGGSGGAAGNVAGGGAGTAGTGGAMLAGAGGGGGGGGGGQAGAGGGQAGSSGNTLGAQMVTGGVSFRVWAPGASSVDLLGDFSTTPIAMTAAAGGVFEALVSGAKAGDRYRYSITHAGKTFTRLDPRGRQIDGTSSVVVDPTAYAWKAPPFTPPDRRDAVIYELHVGSFNDGSMPPAGTFQSVIDKLDSLADLGVSAIEMLPTNHFGSTAGWGYNPQEYFAPRTTYGTPDDLRHLVDEAHARGIGVVLDVVYNHMDGWTGAPLYCFDGDCGGGWSGIYYFQDPTYRSTPWGPRPNFAGPEVKSFLLDGLGTWLGEYRVDGFRWDSTSNIRALDGMGEVPGGKALLGEGVALTSAMRPGALSIAEDLKGFDGMTRATKDGGLGFDAQWDGFVYPITTALVGADDAARDMQAVKGALLGQYNGDPFQRVLCVENHDTVGNGSARLPQRIDGKDPGSWAARKRSMLAAGLLLTAPGIPMLFMGQEFLERGSFTNPPSPLDWTKATTFGPVRDYYRDLVRLRRDKDGHSAGLRGANVAVHHVNDGAKVIGYRRWDKAGDDVIVLVNLSAKKFTQYDLGLPAAGTWTVRVDSDRTAYSTDFGGGGPATIDAKAVPRDGLPYTGSFVLGPYSIVIVSK